MRVHVITVGFGPINQIAAMLDRFRLVQPKSENSDLVKCYLVSGHYPLWTENERLEILPALCTLYGFTLLDPGKDIGSAQSQNWAIEQIKPRFDDYIINLDPDAACDRFGWIARMLRVMEADTKLALLHLLNPVVWECIVKFRILPVEDRIVAGELLKVPLREEQFNITMWRVSALKTIGGIKQLHPFYGQVEGPMWHAVRKYGWYSAYLWNVMEAYDLKLLEDKEFEQYKMAHAHDHSFMGKFADYLKHIGRLPQ